jgi:hypothetical protein
LAGCVLDIFVVWPFVIFNRLPSTDNYGDWAHILSKFNKGSPSKNKGFPLNLWSSVQLCNSWLQLLVWGD